MSSSLGSVQGTQDSSAPSTTYQPNWLKLIGTIVMVAGVALVGFSIIYGLGAGSVATLVLVAGMPTGAGVGSLGALIYAEERLRKLRRLGFYVFVG